MITFDKFKITLTISSLTAHQVSTGQNPEAVSVKFSSRKLPEVFLYLLMNSCILALIGILFFGRACCSQSEVPTC